jgi:phosphohistidine phosphatase
MTNRLYFLRHGLADWPNWTGPDGERPLTPEGIRKMKDSARTLKRLDLAVEAILSSPLIRAKQTAEFVAERLKLKVTVVPSLAPGFGIHQLSDVLAEYADAQIFMLVGHEPDFSTTISKLIGGGNVMMKKGGLARVDLDSLDPLHGQLVWLLAPAVLTAE